MSYLPDHSYKIPDSDENYIVSFSGGRSSAYMLKNILEANGGAIPENCYVIFANTGKEDPRTLDFVRDCGNAWGVEIIWLEYWYDVQAKGWTDPFNKVKVVDYETAARNGEPFADLVKQRQYYLPNVVTRFCTMELKVNSIDRYMRRVQGIKDYKKFLGIRYDERNRWAKALLTEDCKSLFPMVTSKIKKEDILTFWSDQDFDLHTPDLLGNCDMCFLKGRSKLAEIFRQHPEHGKWWIEQERISAKGREDFGDVKSNARFIKTETYQQIKSSTEKNKLLWDGVFDLPTNEEIDCFCGD